MGDEIVLGISLLERGLLLMSLYRVDIDRVEMSSSSLRG